MNKIAIIASGKGETTERIIKLFREGNRISTEFVIGIDLDKDTIESIRKMDTKVLDYTRESFKENIKEIEAEIEKTGVVLLATDGYNGEIPEQLVDAVQGKVIGLTTPEEGPREVVRAFSVTSEPEIINVRNDSEEDSPEQEWARSLKINFKDPKLSQTPPPIPSDEDGTRPPALTEEELRSSYTNSGENPHREQYYDNNQQRQNDYYQREEQHQHNEHRAQNEHYNHDKRHEPMPPTYLIWAILITVFCCFIPGIVAIVFSSQVSTRYYSGDIEGAWRASRNAEAWIIVSFVLGVLAATLYVPFMLIN